MKLLSIFIYADALKRVYYFQALSTLPYGQAVKRRTIDLDVTGSHQVESTFVDISLLM